VDPHIEVCRKEVEQRILMAKAHGGWEGTHNDFKRELGTTHRDYAKLIRHLLAFANTPRRTDAYIIYGVNENKDIKLFEHIGVTVDGFPPPETIEQLVHHYTRLKDVYVDAHYTLDGKRTPYLVIPLQYEGPHFLTQTLNPGPGAIHPRDIFCRYGSRSVRATERDLLRMNSDWGAWFLDCRYEKSATSLSTVLEKRFPKYRQLEDIGPCVRLVYESLISNEFGTQEVPALIHAYWGFDPVDLDAVRKIESDEEFPAFSKTIIGTRFAARTRDAAKTAKVQCVLLDEIYFVNDPYAKLCREFLRGWDLERSNGHLSYIVDLDYRINEKQANPPIQRSILNFLEQQLHREGRSAVLVHGDFGCGKTTTAKRLVADLYDEYLRGNSQVPKILYLNVNGIDIRSRRDECIESELRQYRLSAECVNDLLGEVEADKISLIFDGVDEIAKPHTVSGRKEAIGLLRSVVNRRTAVYCVRSSYYPDTSDMISSFAPLADHDFKKKEKRLVAAQILGLRQEQITDYLDSRLGSEDAQLVRSTLHRIGLESFLRDPLIASFLAELIEEEGIESLHALPQRPRKTDFLGHLVDKLLDREQKKRQRHRALAEDFELFQRVLRAVAFSMICQGSFYISPSQLEAFVTRSLETIPDRTGEDVDSFRTMAWIHRSADDALAFRHEALTLFCAAQHVCAMFERRDALGLENWDPSAPLADIVCAYAGDIIKSDAVLNATAMLGGDLQINVKRLIKDVLEVAKHRDDFGEMRISQLEERTIGAICRGIAKETQLAQLPIDILLKALGGKRALQVTIVLLWFFSRTPSPGAVVASLHLLHRIVKRDWNFCDELRLLKEDPGSAFDAMLLKELHINTKALIDATSYEAIFKSVHSASDVDIPTKQYADRTLRAIEGERNRRIKAHRKEGASGG
jgi:hypothetical protein